MKNLLLTVIVGLVGVTAQAAIFSTDLPRSDDWPPSEKKPVKRYILSGQSNMVRFGTLKGAKAVYPRIHLSADPSVMPCRIPVGASASLPHRFYQEATGDAQGAKAANLIRRLIRKPITQN